MSRYLKTKFPCRHCGEPTEVERLREKDFATCERCGERYRARSRAHWVDEDAKKKREHAEDADNTFDLVLRWLKAAERRVEAAALFVEALPVLTPSERRHYLKAAKSRARHVHSILEQLGKHFDELIADEDHGFRVLEGGGEIPEGAPTVTIRMIGRDEA